MAGDVAAAEARARAYTGGALETYGRGIEAFEALSSDLRLILSANREMREALEECVSVMAMQEHPRSPDTAYHDEVKALGERIGFGALMATASAGWREVSAEKGYPTGGEFVAGPCFSTLTATLRKARSALTTQRGDGE